MRFIREELEAPDASVSAARPILSTARDRAVILEAPRARFCTERAIAAWQCGEDFPNARPKTVRKV